MTKIIAFAGRKQSGKTTCSEFVTQYLNGAVEPFNSTKIYNFADPLKKDICMNILNMSERQCYGTDDDKNTLTECYLDDKQLTAREVMQYVGTNFFRKIKHDVWISATINKIKQENPNFAIIADCRFPNEVEAIKNNNGIVIKLTRNPYNSDHSSEIALDPLNYDQNNFDLIIDNRNITINQQDQIIYNYLLTKGILPF
jgi:hypothetical protein